MKKKSNNSFGFLMTDTGRLVGKRFDQKARDVLDLSRAQCSVLAHLDRHPNIHQAQLADLLGVTPIAGARLLDRMEGGGWIVRMNDAHDRRLRRPQLTPKARNALSDARKVGQAVADEALAGFSAEEIGTFTELLERVRANLARAVEADAGPER